MDSIAGSHGGEHVEVEGSFDNWGVRHAMQKSGKDFTIIKLLPPGVYQVCHHTCATDPETKLCGQSINRCSPCMPPLGPLVYFPMLAST